MWIPQEYVLEEQAARTEYYFVCSNLLVIHCGQGNICKVLVIPQLAECMGSGGVRLVPAKTEFGVGHFGDVCVWYKCMQGM